MRDGGGVHCDKGGAHLQSDLKVAVVEARLVACRPQHCVLLAFVLHCALPCPRVLRHGLEQPEFVLVVVWGT